MKKEVIYELMCGLVEESYIDSAGKIIKNEFAEGEPCCELYEQVYQANKKLCDKLQEEEIEEVEIIINSMFEIMKIIALKMYDCGKGE